MLTQHDADLGILVVEQTRQFQNTLARNDHLVAIGLFDAGLHRTHGQAMAIGGDGTQHAAGHFDQHAVEVIAHVLLGHGECAALDELAQLALRDGE